MFIAANAEQRAYGKERDQRGDTIQDDEIAYNRGQDKIANMWTALGNGYYPTDAAATLNLLQEDLDWNKRLSRSKGEAELAQYAYSTLQAKNALAAAQRNSQLAAYGGSSGGRTSRKRKSGGGGNGNGGGEYTPIDNPPKAPLEVSNRHGETWVEVPGMGRLTIDELELNIENGKIVETVENGKVKYTKVK